MPAEPAQSVGALPSLAELRRAAQRAGDGPQGVAAVGVALRDIHARWLAQVGTAGRTGPDWDGYLTGGLDALAQVEPLMPDDEGRGARDQRADPDADQARPVIGRLSLS